MARTVMETVRCRQCGAETRAWEPKYCWLCRALLEAPARAVVLPPATAQRQAGRTSGLSTHPGYFFPEQGKEQRQAERTFDLSTLLDVFPQQTVFVILALCAGLFGVFQESPGLGILLVILVTPAVVATFVDAPTRRARGRPMTVWEKLGNFAAKAGIVVCTIVVGLVAAFGALRVICWHLLHG